MPAFTRGEAQMLLIHASDEAMALEASGMASAARVWGWNEHVIAGPSRIRPVCARPAMARRRCGALPKPARPLSRCATLAAMPWCSACGGAAAYARCALAARRQARARRRCWSWRREQAYAVVGHIPLAFGKMGAPGIELLLHGDPLMRRPYVLLTPGPRHPASAAQRRAVNQLADYLLSDAGQQILKHANGSDGPWVFARDSVPAGMSTGVDG